MTTTNWSALRKPHPFLSSMDCPIADNLANYWRMCKRCKKSLVRFRVSKWPGLVMGTTFVIVTSKPLVYLTLLSMLLAPKDISPVLSGSKKPTDESAFLTLPKRLSVTCRSSPLTFGPVWDKKTKLMRASKRSRVIRSHPHCWMVPVQMRVFYIAYQHIRVRKFLTTYLMTQEPRVFGHKPAIVFTRKKHCSST